MTNIIKAPIQRVRRRGPNGEYYIAWSSIEDEVFNRLDAVISVDHDWQLIKGFYQYPRTEALSDDNEKEEWDSTVAIAIILTETHEIRFFSLAKLMPELECW